MISYYADRLSLYQVLQYKIKPVYSVLDVGAGLRPMPFFKPQIHIMVEPYHEYVNVLSKQQQQDKRFITLQGTIQQILPFLSNGIVDSLYMLDFIEHLPKEEGVQLLREVPRLVRSQIVIFTPLGFMPQHMEEGEKDGWGLSGTCWQEHHSGWMPEELGADWDCYVCQQFFFVDFRNKPLPKPYGAFYAILNK